MAGAPDPIAELERLLVVHRRSAGAVARSSGLSLTQQAVLAELRVDGRLTPGVLSERLGMSTGGLTPVLDALVERGLVERREDPGDRRRRVVVATDEGEAALAQALAGARRALDRCLESLDEHERGAVASFLRAAADAYAAGGEARITREVRNGNVVAA